MTAFPPKSSPDAGSSAGAPLPPDHLADPPPYRGAVPPPGRGVEPTFELQHETVFAPRPLRMPERMARAERGEAELRERVERHERVQAALLAALAGRDILTDEMIELLGGRADL